MRKRLWLLFFILYSWGEIHGQDKIVNPVKWSHEVQHLNDQLYKVVFTATIDDGWAIYSKETEPDGPIPTTLHFDSSSTFRLPKPWTEIGDKIVGREPLFDNILVTKYKKKLQLEQIIEVLDPTTPVTGYLTYMSCNDKMCLPPTDYDFTLHFNNNKKGSDKPTKNTINNPSTPINSSPPKENSSPPADDNGGILKPVKWNFSLQKLSDTLYQALFTAHIDKGWYVYSNRIEGEGPIPTSVTFEKSEAYYPTGQLEESGPHRISGVDPIFGIPIVKYKEEVQFRQQLVVKDSTKPITGELEFMTCDDKRCLPPELVPFELYPSAHAEDHASKETENNVLINGERIDQRRESLLKTYKTPLGDCGEEDVVRDKSLLYTFLFGFIGGLLALLTPCVFPMVPLTVSYFTKGSKDRKSGLRNGILYGLSIVVIYVGLGLLITLFFGATALNDLSTNAFANVLFFVIFVIFALSFFGFFELTLPSSWASKTDALAERGGYIGIFFMAFTLAIVSFSCTGPIIGAALVQSATTSMVGPFFVMLGFSLALALPFGLFAAFPAWLNSLPRSGGWMNTVKVVLGFLELALAFKFLSVADMTMHWGILKYETFMLIWILIFGAMAAYLFGWIRFPHDPPKPKISLPRKVFAFATALFTLYLASGFLRNPQTHTYYSLKALSGLAPPAHYNIFMKSDSVAADIKSKYPSYGKCANNLNCFKNYYEAIEYAKEVGKPILLDFTGYGCVNCRKVEEHIWTDKRVWHKLNNDFILVSLYVDDKRALDKELWSEVQNKKLRRKGDIWSDFQIANFRQNTQPLYVMITPDEKVLAKPRGYKEGADEYNAYLECGLKHFQEYYNNSKQKSQSN